jgi:hypothetical protein
MPVARGGFGQAAWCLMAMGGWECLSSGCLWTTASGGFVVGAAGGRVTGRRAISEVVLPWHYVGSQAVAFYLDGLVANTFALPQALSDMHPSLPTFSCFSTSS